MMSCKQQREGGLTGLRIRNAAAERILHMLHILKLRGCSAGLKIDPFLISQISKEIIFMTIFAFVADG